MKNVTTVEDLLGRLKAASAPPGVSTKIVGIDGLGGAGKSTLAIEIASALNAPIVHTDDFASWDNPINWWPRLLEQVLDPLAQGGRPHYQRYDWRRRELADWIDIPATEYLVLEGVSATREAFAPYLAFKIWVETPRDVRFRRGIERDGKEMADQWIEWMAAEDGYVRRERPDEHAHAVVRGDQRRGKVPDHRGSPKW